jgi:hypothetical protein
MEVFNMKSKLYRYLSAKLRNLYKRNDPYNIYFTEWHKLNGDSTLRLNYDLDENSIVFDIGGYEGNFSAEIFCKYNCSLYIFEPVIEFYERIKKRFENNKKALIFNFGLSKNNSESYIVKRKDSSSLFLKAKKADNIERSI